MNYNVKLNFLPLEKTTFKFNIYRKKINSNEPIKEEGFYCYKLPDSSNNYNNYVVSFTDFEDSESYICSESDNRWLTIHYLNYLLEKSFCKLNNLKILKKENFYDTRIFVLIEEVQDFGSKTIWMEPYYFSEMNLYGFLIDYAFIKDIESDFNREVLKLSLSLNNNNETNKSYHIDKYDLIIKAIQLKISPYLELDNNLVVGKTFLSINTRILKNKEYYFGNNRTDLSQFNGIKNFGPYGKLKDEPHYFFIFQKDNYSYALDLVKAFNGELFHTFEGIRKFELSEIKGKNASGIKLDNYEIVEVKKKLSDCEEFSKKDKICIFIFPKDEVEFYYKMKHDFILKGIPTQGVHIETLKNQNIFKWSIASLALQVFSKLGGTPWLVKPCTEDCLIVGIGQAHQRDIITKKIKKYFSYSVLIDSSGRYISMKPLGMNTDVSKYLDEITQNIKELLNTNKSKYSAIVFHIPQKIRNKDINNIRSVLEGAKSNIEITILKINNDSKFFGDRKSVV